VATPLLAFYQHGSEVYNWNHNHSPQLWKSSYWFDRLLHIELLSDCLMFRTSCYFNLESEFAAFVNTIMACGGWWPCVQMYLSYIRKPFFPFSINAIFFHWQGSIHVFSFISKDQDECHSSWLEHFK